MEIYRIKCWPIVGFWICPKTAQFYFILRLENCTKLYSYDKGHNFVYSTDPWLWLSHHTFRAKVFHSTVQAHDAGQWTDPSNRWDAQLFADFPREIVSNFGVPGNGRSQ